MRMKWVRPLVGMSIVVAFPLLLAAAKAPVTKAEAATYKVDSGHSMVLFKIRHMKVANFYGRFNEVTGAFTLDPENPSESKFEFAVNANSVDTANDGRDQHVKSDELLNVGNHPQITFKSTAVKAAGDNAYEVTGDMTFLGKTKSITVRIKKVGEGEARGNKAVGLESRFEIKRSDYGMTAMIGPLSDEVTLMVAIEAIQK